MREKATGRLWSSLPKSDPFSNEYPQKLTYSENGCFAASSDARDDFDQVGVTEPQGILKVFLS